MTYPSALSFFAVSATILYNYKKNPGRFVMSKEKKPLKFRMEDDWFSFYVGIILGLLVLFGVVEHVPW